MNPTHWMASAGVAMLLVAYILKSLEANKLRRENLTISISIRTWRELAILRAGQLKGNTPVTPKGRFPSFYLSDLTRSVRTAPPANGTIEVRAEDLIDDEPDEESSPDWSDDRRKTVVWSNPFRRL